MNAEFSRPIESLGFGISRREGLRGIARNLQILQDSGRVPMDDASGMASSYFDGIIKNVPQGSRAVYWLARLYPAFLSEAEDAVKRGVTVPEELEEAEKRFSQLRFARQEEETSYRPQEGSIFQMDPQVERTIFNALRYNDTGRELFVLPETILPEIPGHVQLSINQQADRYSIDLRLKSVRINIEAEEKAQEEFKAFFGEFYGIDQQENPALHKMIQDLQTQASLNMAIGALRFTEYYGYKQIARRSIAEELQGFSQSIGNVLGSQYKADFYSAGQDEAVVRILNGDTDGEYSLQTRQLAQESEYSTTDGIVVRKREGVSTAKRLTNDYDQFRADLKDELKFAGGIVDWIYQRSGVSTDYRIPLQTPDIGLLNWMEENSLVERMSNPPNNFDDLGGQENLKTEVAQDARNFVAVYHGAGGVLKPQNTVFYGPTGIGKSAFENAIAAHLQTGKVPVFVLKGDLFAQSLQTDVKKSVDELKRVFFYTLMNGGALMIRDFDALLGTRYDPQYTIVEGVLLSELQRIKEEPSTWFIADTQFIGRIPEALLNAHRIGKHREVPLETDEDGIGQIIKALVRKIDKERFQKTKPLDYAEVETEYPIDYKSLALKIQNRGGMIPAQIERLLREEMQSRKEEPVSLQTTSLIDRVDGYFEEEAKLAEIRKAQMAEEQTQRIEHGIKLAEQAIEGQRELGVDIGTLRQGLESLRSIIAGRYSNGQIDQLFDRLFGRINDLEGKLPKRKK